LYFSCARTLVNLHSHTVTSARSLPRPLPFIHVTFSQYNTG